MPSLARPARFGLVFFALLLLLLVPLVVTLREQGSELEEGDKGKQGGQVSVEVVRAAANQPATVSLRTGAGFAPQTRLGFTVGDQWEPAIAADRFGHVYLLYPQYGGVVPGCSNCSSTDPTMILQISGDRGATWAAPTIMYPAGAPYGQWDAQIVVDPIDGRTVYASWLQNKKSNIAVARSTNFGATWSVVMADSTNAGTDKPILLVRGQNVYVGYNHAQKVWVSSSHDGGLTFTSTNVNKTGNLGWSLAGGGAVDPAGNVYFSWAGYTQNGGAKGPVYLYLSKSTDGGNTWTTKLIDTSDAPPDCSAYQCGWAFLGAQMVMTADSTGTLYALWNSNTVDKAPNRIYFSKSTDAGATWSPKADVSAAPAGTAHAFPAIAAGAAGDVRISWMDARASGLWNTYYRSSANGGGTWSAEVDLSTYVAGYSYIQPNGFGFPFGDYYEMEVDDQGSTHAIWGEGLNYDSPGSIWYARGK